MEVNGIAHIQLTVADVTRSKAFWQPFLAFLGMQTLIDDPQMFYCIGSRTGIALSPVDAEHVGDSFVQRRVGLHHVCLRARNREDVDGIFEFVKGLGVKVVHPPQDEPWAPHYYSVLFEDPDGIRIEVNHIPGKGWLDPNAKPAS
jgi:catechol 2,3-dioxygenase-like lactoylglutathione lyase family enzyme